MNTAIYKYLQSDSTLTELLKQTLPLDNKIGVGRAHNSKAYPLLVIQSSPYDMGVAHEEHQLKVVLATKDEDELEAITKRLMELLHTKFKPIQFDDIRIFHSRHVIGGGLFFHPEDEVYEQILYFNFKL